MANPFTKRTQIKETINTLKKGLNTDAISKDQSLRHLSILVDIMKIGLNKKNSC